VCAGTQTARVCDERAKRPPKQRIGRAAVLVWRFGSTGVSKVAFPVAGFNGNIRHRGLVFHLQTEDSGEKNPRIVTHLFADGGRILRTLRTEYREQLGRPDLHDYVRSLMRAQHKAMYVSLRGGELDELIEQACGPLSEPPSRIPASQLSLPPELSSIPVSMPGRSMTPKGRPAHASDEPGSAVHVLPVPEIVAKKRSGSVPPQKSGEIPSVTAPQSRRPGPGTRRSEPPAAAAARPARSAPRAAGAPDRLRLNEAISGGSLDDVILSYLADDLKPPK
jgi:hypothetical protein